MGADSLAELMADHPGTTYRIDTSSDEVLQMLLFSVLPTVIMLVVFIYFMRRMGNQNGQAMSFGKTKALTAEGERPKVKFSDVAGIDEAVEEAKAQGIHGKETTPFLLAKIKDLTGGDSLASNIQLVYNNAKLAAATAVELSKLAKKLKLLLHWTGWELPASPVLFQEAAVMEEKTLYLPTEHNDRIIASSALPWGCWPPGWCSSTL